MSVESFDGIAAASHLLDFEATVASVDERPSHALGFSDIRDNEKRVLQRSGHLGVLSKAEPGSPLLCAPAKTRLLPHRLWRSVL
jgi:hypothetical protein